MRSDHIEFLPSQNDGSELRCIIAGDINSESTLQASAAYGRFYLALNERYVDVTTKYGKCPSFAVCPDGLEAYPGIIFYMDAPGYRTDSENAAADAKNGYYCLLRDMYYRIGTCRFDIPRQDEGMSEVIFAAIHPSTTKWWWKTPAVGSCSLTARTSTYLLDRCRRTLHGWPICDGGSRQLSDADRGGSLNITVLE